MELQRYLPNNARAKIVPSSRSLFFRPNHKTLIANSGANTCKSIRCVQSAASLPPHISSIFSLYKNK